MNAAETIREIYAQYFAASEQAEQKRKPTDGMFGLGKKPADDPCHTAFYDSLIAAVTELAQQNPDPETVREILAYIYGLPEANREPVSVYWMLIAAHGTTDALIPMLTPQDAASLYADYDKRFRRRERMPVQKNILRVLKKASGS